MKYLVRLTDNSGNGIEGEFEALSEEQALAEAREAWHLTEDDLPIVDVSPA